MDEIRVAVANWTGIAGADVLRGMGALQRQLDEDFGPAWRIDATLLPWFTRQRAGRVWGLVLLDASTPEGRDAAEHYGHSTSDGHPLARVFVDGVPPGQDWTHLASRQLLGLLADPDRSAAVYRETGRHHVYARRVCDPCADYADGYRLNGRVVSDFVHPAWFGGRRTRNDQRRRIGRPFEVRPGGWIGVLDPATSAWRALHSDGSLRPPPEEPPEGKLSNPKLEKAGWGP